MPKGINVRNLYLGPRVNNSRIVIKCLFDGELTAFVYLVHFTGVTKAAGETSAVILF